MIKFLYCDSNVTSQIQERISALLEVNLDMLKGPNSALFLQQLLQTEFKKQWVVIILRDSIDLHYGIKSNMQVMMDIQQENTRYLLSQFEHYDDQFQKDQFIKACQRIEESISKNSNSLLNHFIDSNNFLEHNFGIGSQIILYGEEQDTQIHFITSTLNQYTFSAPISEDQAISGVLFYIPSGQQDEFLDSQNNYEQQNKQQEQQGYIEDVYEEPMDTLFSIMLDEKQFKQSTDQVKVSFDELEIQPLKVHSFGIIFYMVVSPFPKEIKDDLNVISTGSSLMSKNLTFGINRDQLFFLNFQLLTGKIETLYSQMKVKRNQLYQVAIVYTDTEFYKEVSLYVNGTIENQINLSIGIEPPRGFFWIGSEQALKLFKGTLRDIVFASIPLHQKHIKSIYAEIQGALNHNFQRNTIEIIEEVLEQLKEELPSQMDESKYTVNQSVLKQQKTGSNLNAKRLQIPTHLQKSYQVFEETAHKKAKQEQPQQTTRSHKEIVQFLQLEFQQNESLHFRCHELSINFFWVFTSIQQLAPPFEENGNPKLPFEYLHQEIVKEKFDQYPVYAIEFERLAKVIHHGGIQLSNDDIYQLACITDSVRTNKIYGNYILYDKFLLIIREASLNEQELEMVQSQYNTDEKEIDQDLIIFSQGIQKVKPIPEHNFSFFQQLTDLVGSETEAFKFNIINLVAYFVQNDHHVQKLTAVYQNKETNQIVEIEGIDFFAYDQDKIFQQKLDISQEAEPKYFRVHYNGDNMAMVAFKTHRAEETFMIDKTFDYKEGEDATGLLETYAFEQLRLAGFRGTTIKKDGSLQLIMLQAEYLQKDPKVEEFRKSQPETLPQLPESWSQGRFQIIINRCSDCDKHNTTTWHDETDFALKFNELGQIFKDLFPNVEIIGNWDKTQQLEHFDVYIRGIGPQTQWDKEGRYFLFRKNETLKTFISNFYKRILKIYDEIVLVAQAYGDTVEMAKRQEIYLKTQQYPQKSKIAQEHPCPVPDRPEKINQEDNNLAGTDFICKNWGCGQPFKYENNPNAIKKCKHHPGRYEFGSKHGLWPECWTCCGKSWDSEGCRMDQHKGIPEKDCYQICINVGQVDPKTGYPESVCGMKFIEGEGECRFNGGVHQSAKWPDPQAKVYFIQKNHQNPALKEKDAPPQRGIQLRPDMYRETRPYMEFINKDRQRLMKLIDTEKETRCCTNWACGKQYKEIENRKKRTCKCHPGVYDFGHTATTISEAVEEYKLDKGSKILWRPHWTCCRKPWNEPGCILQQHSGPLQTEYKPRKYQWPDPNAQIYFKKKVSENWTRMLNQQYSLTSEQASFKYDKLCASIGSGGQISAFKLPELCDKFKMQLWVCSEDLSFQFKFEDIMEGRAQDYLADTHGNIDKHKYLDWWFADVNHYLEITQK